MSRRAIVAFVAASAAVLGGLTPLLLPANAAAPCVAFPDASGDAGPTVQGQHVPANDGDLDLTNVGFSSTATDLVVVDTLAKLTDSGPDAAPGDGFYAVFTFNKHVFEVAYLRFFDEDTVFGDSTYGTMDGATLSPAPAIKAAFDFKASTATLTWSRAEIEKLAGASTKDATITALGGKTTASYPPQFTYDRATAPATMSFTFDKCGGGAPAPGPAPAPTPSPSPSPSPSPTGGGAVPAGYPAAGCANFVDAKGDGIVGSQDAPVAVAPNDPDLDITGTALQTSDAALKVFVRVDKLAARPSNGIGNAWDVTFTYNKKEVELYATFGPDNGISPIPPSSVFIDGDVVSAVKMTAVQDVDHSYVVYTVDRPTFEKALGAALVPGTPFEGLSVESGTYVVTGYDSADVAAPAATATYKVGDDVCFGPPAAKLLNAGKTAVQYTDAAALAAKLTSASGAPLAGKTVTFAIGSAKATAKTGSDGVARASLNPNLTAGAYSLVTSFAGDTAAGKVELTTPFTVTPETTRIVLSVSKSGTKRTVVAKLVDDDGHAVASQPVNWYVNGKKVGSANTNSAGVVTLTTAKPTQTVVAEFLAVTGKYAASKATAKV